MKSDIVMEIKGGRFTGNALVFVENEEIVLDAVEALNRHYIGERYVEVLRAKEVLGMM